MQKSTLPGQRVALSGPDGVERSWFLFFDQLDQNSGALSDAVVVTAEDQTSQFRNSLVLTPVSGELVRLLSTTEFTLGLADSGVTGDAYGDASHTLSIVFDAKGRATDAVAIPLNTSNITEGSNLYYTDVRARAAISGAHQVSYNPATGVIDTTGTSVTRTHPVTGLTIVNGIVAATTEQAGFTGTVTPVNSITVVDGIVTAVS